MQYFYPLGLCCSHIGSSFLVRRKAIYDTGLNWYTLFRDNKGFKFTIAFNIVPQLLVDHATIKQVQHKQCLHLCVVCPIKLDTTVQQVPTSLQPLLDDY